MENLDLEFLTEQGQVAEACLRAVLAEFGGVEKFRCFDFLALACVQYSTPEQASTVSHPASACVPCNELSPLQDTMAPLHTTATESHAATHSTRLTPFHMLASPYGYHSVAEDCAGPIPLHVNRCQREGKCGALHPQALAALHEGVIGRREARLCYVRLFPSDVLLKHRLGPKVWQMYATSEADLAARSKAQAQQKERQRAAQEAETAAREAQLRAAAQAFKPSSPCMVAAAAPEASLSCLRGLSCNGARSKTHKSGRVGCLTLYQ